MALTGNKSTYLKIPEFNEKIILVKNNHNKIIDKKIRPNFINTDLLMYDFDSTIPFIPRPHCNKILIVNPE
jgi:hypothetical protein